MTAIANKKIDQKTYSKLLARAVPTVITSEAEYARQLAVFDKLFHKDQLSPEEEALFELLTFLIENYEKEQYKPGEGVTGLDILKSIMEDHSLQPKDLWEIFGSKGITSEVLSGKRQISKSHAKALGKRFGLDPKLFITFND